MNCDLVSNSFFFSTKYKAVWKQNQQSLLKSLGTPSVYVHSGTGMSWTGIDKNQRKAKTSKKKYKNRKQSLEKRIDNVKYHMSILPLVVDFMDGLFQFEQ